MSELEIYKLYETIHNLEDEVNRLSICFTAICFLFVALCLGGIIYIIYSFVSSKKES